MGLDGDQAILEASASDPLVRLTEASFAVNGKRWSNIFPVDGLFDSKTENFRFKTDALRPGSYVVMLRVKNAAGNVGASDVLFAVGGGNELLILFLRNLGIIDGKPFQRRDGQEYMVSGHQFDRHSLAQ